MMSDTPQSLVHDLTLHLKDPLFPKQTLFASSEEIAFFKNAPSPQEHPQPPLPLNLKTAVRDCLNLPSPTAVFGWKGDKKPLEKTKEAPVLEMKNREDHPPNPKPVKPEIQALSTRNEDSAIEKRLHQIAPTLKLLSQIPEDGKAKRIANGWKERIEGVEVVLLACQTDEETLELLKNLGKAIDQHLGKTKILPGTKMENENRWELFLQRNRLRLIIASEGIQNLPHLLRFYLATPATSESFLDQTPLLVLSSASVYKAVAEKALLWKTLCQMLKK